MIKNFSKKFNVPMSRHHITGVLKFIDSVEEWSFIDGHLVIGDVRIKVNAAGALDVSCNDGRRLVYGNDNPATLALKKIWRENNV